MPKTMLVLMNERFRINYAEPIVWYIPLGVQTKAHLPCGGVTEAGTTQRDVVREGVVQIGVAFRVSKKWLNKFSAYKKLTSITVGYLDMETMNIVNTRMYIDGYQVKLVSDTSYGSLWEVTFTLKEF